MYESSTQKRLITLVNSNEPRIGGIMIPSVLRTSCNLTYIFKNCSAMLRTQNNVRQCNLSTSGTELNDLFIVQRGAYQLLWATNLNCRDIDDLDLTRSTVKQVQVLHFIVQGSFSICKNSFFSLDYKVLRAV